MKKMSNIDIRNKRAVTMFASFDSDGLQSAVKQKGSGPRLRQYGQKNIERHAIARRHSPLLRPL
jgi:hypothetical protein